MNLDYPETSDCEDGEVRLTHRQTGTIGQVQICINQTWNRIRSAIAFWNGRAAAVVCQQLGFIGEGEKEYSEPIIERHLMYYTCIYLLQEVSLGDQ